MLKAQKGFTLIELLVVIAIIGILAVFTLAFLAPARQKGRDATRKQDLNAVAKALELYYSDNDEYPAQASAGLLSANTCQGLTGGDYLQTCPADPQVAAVTADYSYISTAASGAQGYAAWAYLENDADTQAVDGPDGTSPADEFVLCGGDHTYTCSSN